MNTKFDFSSLEDERLVYIRPVMVANLPEDVQQAAGDRDHIYGVHSADGQCIALVKDRKLAFVLARQNDFAPVEVH